MRLFIRLIKLFAICSLMMLANNPITAQILATDKGVLTFKVKAPAKEIHGQNKECQLKLDLKNGKIHLTVNVKDYVFTNNFETDSLNQKIYHRFLNFYMEIDRYPVTIFTTQIPDTILKLLQTQVEVEKQTFKTSGKLVIKEVENKVHADIIIEKKVGKIWIRGTTAIRPKQYKINIPTYIGDFYFHHVFMDFEACL